MPWSGYTLIELVIVLTLTAIALTIAVPRGQRGLDRIAVRSAASDVTALLNSARNLALAGRRPVAVDFDAATGVVRVRRGSEVLLTRNVATAHGVVLSQSRDSLTFGALGLGRGAANLSVVLRRRAAAETVFVSRLGRVR